MLDPVLNEYDVADKLNKALTDRNIEFFVFDEVPNAPDTSVVQRALEVDKDAHIHGIITAGGTKAAKIGRAVAALYNDVHDIYEFVDGATPTYAPIRLLCIPTPMLALFIFSVKTPVIDGSTRRLTLLKMHHNVCKLPLFDPY